MPLSSRTRRLILPLAVFVVGLVALVVAAVVTLVPGADGVAPSGVGGPFSLVRIMSSYMKMKI